MLRPHIASAGDPGLVDQQAVAELRNSPVGVEQSIRALRLHQLTCGDRAGEPVGKGLAGELPNPSRHDDDNPVSSEHYHASVEPCPGRFAWDRPPASRGEDLVLLFEHTDSFT